MSQGLPENLAEFMLDAPEPTPLSANLLDGKYPRRRRGPVRKVVMIKEIHQEDRRPLADTLPYMWTWAIGLGVTVGSLLALLVK